MAERAGPLKHSLGALAYGRGQPGARRARRARAKVSVGAAAASLRCRARAYLRIVSALPRRLFRRVRQPVLAIL